jgi:hypothetical protein
MTQYPPPLPADPRGGFGPGSVVPPMDPSGFEYREPPSWPKVIGIISIVLGGLGLLCQPCGLFVVVGMEAFMQQMAQFQAQAGPNAAGPGQATIPTTPMPGALKYGLLSILSAAGGILGVSLLLVAGINTLRRASSGRMFHLVYAGVSSLFTILSFIGAYQYYMASDAFFKGNPSDEWTKFFAGQGGAGLALVQAGVVSVIALIYPVFIAVWFGVVKTRHEQMLGSNTDEQSL